MLPQPRHPPGVPFSPSSRSTRSSASRTARAVTGPMPGTLAIALGRRAPKSLQATEMPQEKGSPPGSNPRKRIQGRSVSGCGLRSFRWKLRANRWASSRTRWSRRSASRTARKPHGLAASGEDHEFFLFGEPQQRDVRQPLLSQYIQRPPDLTLPPSIRIRSGGGAALRLQASETADGEPRRSSQRRPDHRLSLIR